MMVTNSHPWLINRRDGSSSLKRAESFTSNSSQPRSVHRIRCSSSKLLVATSPSTLMPRLAVISQWSAKTQGNFTCSKRRQDQQPSLIASCQRHSSQAKTSSTLDLCWLVKILRSVTMRQWDASMEHSSRSLIMESMILRLHSCSSQRYPLKKVDLQRSLHSLSILLRPSLKSMRHWTFKSLLSQKRQNYTKMKLSVCLRTIPILLTFQSNAWVHSPLSKLIKRLSNLREHWLESSQRESSSSLTRALSQSTGA